MKKIALLINTILCLLLSCSANVAQAREEACNELGGGVIFMDTIYGIGAGALLSGLAIAATKNHDDIGPKVAAGGLIGGTIGLGYGIYEATYRRCTAENSKPNTSLHIIPTVSLSPKNINFSLAMKF